MELLGFGGISDICRSLSLFSLSCVGDFLGL